MDRGKPRVWATKPSLPPSSSPRWIAAAKIQKESFHSLPVYSRFVPATSYSIHRRISNFYQRRRPGFAETAFYRGFCRRWKRSLPIYTRTDANINLLIQVVNKRLRLFLEKIVDTRSREAIVAWSLERSRLLSPVLLEKYYETLPYDVTRESNLKMLPAFPRALLTILTIKYTAGLAFTDIRIQRASNARPFYFRLPLAIHFLMYARTAGRERGGVGWCDRGTVWKKGGEYVTFRMRFLFHRDFSFFPFFQPTSRLIPWHPNKQFTRN